MTTSSDDPFATAARLRGIAIAILAISAAGLILGVVLDVADHRAAGAWMICSFAGITHGTGFLAIAQDAHFQARLQAPTAVTGPNQSRQGRR